MNWETMATWVGAFMLILATCVISYEVHMSGVRTTQIEALQFKRIQCHDRGGYMAMYSPYEGDCLIRGRKY